MRTQQTAIQEAINRVLDSGHYILGPEVEALEWEVSAEMGMRYGVGVANGTDAITLALLALKHQKSIINSHQALVATVANSAPPTVVAIRRAGCTPVFIDVLPNGLMDPADLSAKMRREIMAVVPVHLYGQSAQMLAISSVCERFSTPIIEDAAQAIGTFIEHKSKFLFARCVSFYPTKNLGAIGDGGMILTDNYYVKEVIKRLRVYGLNETGNVALPNGFNSRLDELQAAILRERLKDMRIFQSIRRAIATEYFEMLNPVILHRTYNQNENYHLFTIRYGNRNYLQEQLKDKGIETKVHYPVPAHQYHIEGMYVFLPETVALCREVLSLPLWPGMTPENVRTVCKAVNESLPNG